jgi:fucose 4-O-acetylase-like acetyltransferase
MVDSREQSKKLSEELFCSRGMGILLVVLVHVLGVDAIHGVRKLFSPDRADLRQVTELIHSFNMATMIMASGVVMSAFGRPDTSFGQFLRKKLDKLIVPMLVWAPVLLIAQESSHGRLPGVSDGPLALLQFLFSAWFPPYSIFWYVYALAGCTLMSWLFRRWAEPRLGRWSRLTYFGLAVLLHLTVSTWRARSSSGPGEYVELILYWNRFFGLGFLIQPWLEPVRRFLAGLPVALQALVPVGLLSLLVLFYSVIPEERYETLTCAINGPLGFSMLLTLAMFLRERAAQWGGLVAGAWRRLVFTGSISMTLYLFHVYFVAGTRIVLERWFPGTPLAAHLVLGVLLGVGGPWLLFHVLKGQRSFHWSVGLSSVPQR